MREQQVQQSSCEPRPMAELRTSTQLEAGFVGREADSASSSGSGPPSRSLSHDTDATADPLHSQPPVPTGSPAPGETRSLATLRGALEELARNGTLGGGSSDANSETAAAAAERHRLANSVGLDLQATWQWFEKAVPFLALLLVVFVYQHIIGICTFIWLHALLSRANELIRKQVALKQERSKAECLSYIPVAGCHAAVTLFLFRKQRLWLNFALIGTAPSASVWDILFRVAITDLLARFFGISVKGLIIAYHKHGTRHELRRRSRLLTVTEHVLSFYRSLLATPLWYQFLINSHMGSVLSSTCAGMYLILKCALTHERGAMLVVAAKALLQRQSFGKAVTAAELCEIGSQCAICQETLQGPVKLQCNHIFCDACVTEWLERERTCPMCRAVVQPQGFNANGDGSTSLLPQLF